MDIKKFWYTKLILLLFFSLTVTAQQSGEPVPGSDSAVMKVVVTDMNDNPKKGEQVIFVDTASGKQYKGITNEQGEFSLKLPGPGTYQTKIKAFGAGQEYKVVSIPPLKPNQYYGVYEFYIKFSFPKTYTLDRVYFDVNKATLREESYNELNELVEYLKRKPDTRIEIAGHTDNTGTEEDNMALSRRRAQRVRQYLIEKGIDEDRVIAKGYGESMPIATNETKEGRQQNRRTEVHILSE